MNRFLNLMSVLTMVIGMAAGSASAAWTTYYTHTQDPAAAFGADIFSIRGLALAQNGSGDVYYGHIQIAKDGAYPLPEETVNVVRLDSTGALLGYRTVSGYPVTAQPKTLATDDRGNVYTAFADGTVHVYSSDLSVEVTSFSANPTRIEGVAVERSGGSYYLYTSSRDDGVVKKFDVTTVGSPSLVTSRDLTGTNARGLAVDSSSNVYVADKNGTVFKIAADFGSDTSTSVADVTNAFDIAVDGSFAYVSRQDAGSSAITKLLLSTLVVQGVLTDSIYSTSDTGLAGIDIDATGNIWIADEDAVRTDPDVYIDRIYTIPVPEPASLVLAGIGSVVFAGFAASRGIKLWKARRPGTSASL